MGLSTALLLVAALAALLPIAAVGPHPPRRIRDLEKALVVGFVVVVVGAIVARFIYDIDFFGVVHLLYLLVVVTVPLVLGGWCALAMFTGERVRIHDLAGVAAALIAAVGLYTTHIEPTWLRTDRVELAADIGAPLRIGVIADLQTPNVGEHERQAIANVIADQPDLVVIPGDWFQGSAEQITAERPAFVDLLRLLVANSDVVAVTTGDSDHSVDLGSMVTEAGALFIDDKVLDITIDGTPVRLAGVRVLANGPDRGLTLETLHEPSPAFTVLVAHRPDVVYELGENADVDLVISGHTHGGQVAFPFFGPPVTFSDVPREVASGGLSTVEGVPLYVSTGVGLERFQAPQVRFGVRPSVGIIEVVPQN